LPNFLKIEFIITANPLEFKTKSTLNLRKK
jgi:hypothetical protein